MAHEAHTEPSRQWLVLALCVCAFLVSIGINFTRVPIIYAFRVMTCDEYYRHHAPYAGTGDKCSLAEIEASTATAVSVLGATITVNGLLNLVFANWAMKTFGMKAVLIQQLAGPTVRLGVQLIGVHVGAGKGILLVQIAQLLGVVGGSTGYVLVLTTFVSRVVSGTEQTLAFGRLQGAIMLGTAVAYLGGGWISDYLGINAAFEGACLVMVVSIVYCLMALPSLPPVSAPPGTEPGGRLAKVLGPFRSLLSTRSVGGQRRSYQRPLLGMGVFCGVLATGFIPILLQMYSTNAFGFNSRENGYLMALTFGVRSVFLTLLFPVIIRTGRRWISPSQTARTCDSASTTTTHMIDESAPLLGAQPRPRPRPRQLAASAFDLVFLIASFFADAVFTAATAFAQEGWQLYIAAAVLPLASGSAPAAKGVIISLCEPWERSDALSGIAMVEMLATVLTMTIFGAIFSALAQVGQSRLVFFINGGLALVATLLVMFVKPPRQETPKSSGDSTASQEEQ